MDSNEMVIGLEEAQLIARALIVVNNHAVEEAGKIINSDASEYLKAAANKQYQDEMEAYTRLHLRLAETFPELTHR